jgi:hypothetical protein
MIMNDDWEMMLKEVIVIYILNGFRIFPPRYELHLKIDVKNRMKVKEIVGL